MEELIESELEMGEKFSNFVDVIYQVHIDNSKQQYFAQSDGPKTSIMPLTPFIFEFFLFNSLYQVDWGVSVKSKDVRKFPQDDCESHKQSEFFKSIKKHAKKHPADLYRAFEPLSIYPSTDADWTTIKPDPNISKFDGEKFFRRIRMLQVEIQMTNRPDEMSTSNTKVMDPIKECIRYINNIRNNIFHGSKRLGQTYDHDQKKRIEVYDLFLKGVTSLFFLAIGKQSVASDFTPCRIYSNTEILNLTDVWDALNKRLMKVGDSRVISQFMKEMRLPKKHPLAKSALFYPSSGSDMLTPLLLGLPYCRQFYFYDCQRARSHSRFVQFLKKVPKVEFKNHGTGTGWVKRDNLCYLEFVYDGHQRKIFWIRSDNMEFLNVDVDLAMYFHRGDSWGEGGSGQKWDSKLLPMLATKVPRGKKAVFLTDGEPGGIDERYVECRKMINTPFPERNRNYYFGTLANDDRLP